MAAVEKKIRLEDIPDREIALPMERTEMVLKILELLERILNGR